MIKQSIKMSISSILSNKLRSFLTMLGIIIGVITICLVVTMISAISDTIINEFGTFAGKLCTVYFRVDKLSLSKEDVQQMISESSCIEKACIFDSRDCSVESGRYRGLKAVGMYGDVDLEKIYDIRILTGRGINGLDLQNGSHVAVISYTAAEDLFGNGEQAVGKTFSIYGWETTVIGVREKTTLNEGFGADIFIPELFYTAVFPEPYNSNVLVLMRDDDSLECGMEQIQSFLYDYYQADDSVKRHYTITTLEGTINSIQLISTAIKALMLLISAISMIIGGIGIMNIMLVSVSERTKEIGIKKSLGATKVDIISQFLIESIIICCFGIAIGIGLSYILIAVLRPVVEELLGGVKVPMTIHPGSIVLSAVFSLAVGIFFCWSPAKKAANLKPVEALRK